MDAAAARRMFGSLPVVNVATVGPDGTPHVVPLWFVWPEDAVYVSVRCASRTWANASAGSRVSLAIDLGRSWVELAGAVVEGTAEPFPAEHPSVRSPMSAWHEKYRPLLSGDGFRRFTEDVAEFGFLKVVPERVLTWDHARG